MGGMSWMHWAIVIGLIALLFGGRGKIASIMGDAAKGIKAFKHGLKDDGEDRVESVPAATLAKQEARPDL